MDRFIQFLLMAEGRCKFGKVLQYSSRIIQWHQKGVNEQIHLAFKNFYRK